VQTVGVSWQGSFETAAVCAATGIAAALSSTRAVRWAGALARELAVIGVLYGLWELAGMVAVTGTDDAFVRARWVRDFERHLPLPTERTMQHLVLGHPLAVQGANYYYAAMHLSTMGAFLAWLFVRHRDQYRPVRQVMAWTTLACLLIQLMPVAPPRMLPGIVDTGRLYNQSVYSGGLAVDQLSAMPSVHVAWAVTIGYYVWRLSPSRWRWIGPAHALLMTLIVVITGNHWWLDGLVAIALLALCAWSLRGARTAWHALLARHAVRTADEDEPQIARALGVD
jgi:hypothetical protein